MLSNITLNMTQKVFQWFVSNTTQNGFTYNTNAWFKAYAKWNACLCYFLSTISNCELMPILVSISVNYPTSQIDQMKWEKVNSRKVIFFHWIHKSFYYIYLLTPQQIFYYVCIIISLYYIFDFVDLIFFKVDIYHRDIIIGKGSKINYCLWK